MPWWRLQEFQIASTSLLAYPERRCSKRTATNRRASLVVKVGSHFERVPCLVVDRSPYGFRLRGDFRLRRGQVVEVITDGDANGVQCSVVWIGKRGSKHEGKVGLETV